MRDRSHRHTFGHKKNFKIQTQALSVPSQNKQQVIKKMLTALRALAIPLLVYSTATLDQVAPTLEDTATTTSKPIMPVIEKLIDSTTPTSTSNSNRRQSEKTIYLIRHAESLENVAYKGARSVQASYAARKVPDPKDVVDAIKLAFLMFRPEVMNAALSSLGEEQVRELHSSLQQDQFWNKLKQQASSSADPNGGRVLLAHSPLVRAKQTAYGALLGPQRMAPDEKADDVTDIDIEEIPSLREVNPKEIIGDAIMPWKKEKTVDKRIAEFEEWLNTRPEDTLVVVGHSVYFKRMLNLPETFNNVDVWEARYGGGNVDSVNDVMGAAYQESKAMVEDMISGQDSEMSTHLPRQWKSLKRLYRYTPKTQVEEVDEADMNEMMERVQEDMMERTKEMWY